MEVNTFDLIALAGFKIISSYSKEEYEEFFKWFFLLTHNNVKETARIAFLNADWRDF